MLLPDCGFQGRVRGVDRVPPGYWEFRRVCLVVGGHSGKVAQRVQRQGGGKWMRWGGPGVGRKPAWLDPKMPFGVETLWSVLKTLPPHGGLCSWLRRPPWPEKTKQSGLHSLNVPSRCSWERRPRPQVPHAAWVGFYSQPQSWTKPKLFLFFGRPLETGREAVF